MADIELVIKIPEKTANEIKDNAMFAGSVSSDIRWDVTSAIVNSILLPKGHGRLIDADALIKSTDKEEVHMYEIALASTIIEADKGSEEEE